MHRGSCTNCYLNNREYNYCPHYKFIERTCDNHCEKKTQLKTISNIALACLATTDCFMGVIGQPTFIALNIVILQVDGSNTYCFIRKLSNAVVTVLGRASLLT